MLKHTAIQARQSAKKTKKEEMVYMYGSVLYLTSVAWRSVQRLRKQKNRQARDEDEDKPDDDNTNKQTNRKQNKTKQHQQKGNSLSDC